MSYKLYSDKDTWHYYHDIKEPITSIACTHGIGSRYRLINWNYDTKEYRCDGTGFIFEIRTVNE